MAISRERAREIVARLKRLVDESGIEVVIPARPVMQPCRFPATDLVFSIVSPKADESDAKIELVVLKSRTPEPYRTMRAESSFCPECGRTVTLLSNGESPQFYLCWCCRWLGEVGVGPVQKFRGELGDDDAAGH